MTEDEILLLFDPDPRRAENMINNIFEKMVSFFAWNRSRDDRDLAQEVFVRVLRNFNAGTRIEPEKLKPYFYGVAKNLLRESKRGEWRRAETPLDEATSIPDGSFSPEDRLHVKRCLEDCEDYELLEHYYASRSRSDKKQLAVQTGLSSGGLGAKVHRIKKDLGRCLGFVERPKLRVD